MATNSKTEKILIGIDDQVIELTGVEKETFLAERAKALEEINLLKQKQEELKQLKISAYKKLGLTDEEIAAII